MARVSASDWIGLHCGDYVRERDGRHVARVEAVTMFIPDNPRPVRVRWLDTRWTSHYALGELVKLTRRERLEYEKGSNT
jgi:hypothetical protein